MKWFSRRSGRPRVSAVEQRAIEQAAEELLDPYHHRSSVRAGDRLFVEPGQVLENIAHAMERLDLDIDAAISIEEDVAGYDEIQVLVQTMEMGELLAVHVVNTAMRIMAARYPAELVGRPLPPEFDLRRLQPLPMADRQHDIAKAIFNQRTTSDRDLAPGDVAGQLEPLGPAEQIEVFLALFCMYATKIGALKYGTGIE